MRPRVRLQSWIPAAFLCGTIVLRVLASTILQAGELPEIDRVELQSNGAFHVNGQPFFPLMAWLQDAENLSAVKETGMNSTAGFWPGSGEMDVAQYLTLVKQAGLYGIVPFDKQLAGHGHLLGYIHGDEPDLPRQVNDAEIVPGENLKINPSTPLWRLVDGVVHSWSVLDPLEGAQWTIRLKQPVTVESLAVWVTVSGDLPVAKDVTFTANEQEILTAKLENKKGRQTFRLNQPATFQELTIKVLSVYSGAQEWGSISEIEGLDAAGKNVLLTPPRHVPRAEPAATLKEFQAIKASDPTRPIFMTVTGNFHPFFKKWTEQQRQSLYPQYIAAADVVGYDIYPIYGWNKPEWIHLVHEATGLLKELAGNRPVYAWIETSRGGQWTGPLERQQAVTPRDIRAEVWMSICRGATAIGYFTHIWKPSYKQFGVPQENRDALRSINDQITRLAPAILAAPWNKPMSISSEDGIKLDIMGRVHDGSFYLFAVNFDPARKGTTATISVDSLPGATTIAVIDEDRTVRSAAGTFSDRFEPLEVHVYRLEIAP